jgi:hypothetical protein
LALATAAVLVVVIYVARSEPDRYLPTLVGTRALLPWIAAIASSAIYLANNGERIWRINAVLIGGGFALLFLADLRPC